MPVKHRTLNEERGERRAAELRRRFARVSRQAMGRRSFAAAPGRQRGALEPVKAGDILRWGALTLVLLFVGLALF